MVDENTLKNIADGIVNFAPGIATALRVTGVGAPAAMAVSALGALGKAFGFGNDANPGDLHTAIQADPESAVKLAVAEMDFQLKQRDQELQEMRIQMAPYLEGLKTQTIPWVDALHKMGRQISNWLTMAIIFTLMMFGKPITPEVVAILGLGNGLYHVMKGKGNPTEKGNGAK